MPVDANLDPEGMIYQREQYAKGGLGVRYWDFRDRQALRHVVGEKVLDIGCGEGITLEKLLREFPQKSIIGVDLEAENIAICQQHGLPVIAGSVYSLPFPEHTFDCVLFSEVIEHLETPEIALAEIQRVLKPGGRLILIFPNDGMFKVARLLTGNIKEACYDPGHVMQWTPEKIQRALGAQGFHLHRGQSIPFGLWPISLHYLAVADKAPPEVVP